MRAISRTIGTAWDRCLARCQRAALTVVFVLVTGWATPIYASCPYYACYLDWLYTCPIFCGYYESYWRWYDLSEECFCTLKECVQISYDSPGGNCYVCNVSYGQYCGVDG